MPRFYFHIRENGTLTEDHDGLDLPDIVSAFAEAQDGARGLVAEAIKMGNPVDQRQFEVTDAAGTLLLVYPFSRVIRGSTTE